MDVKKRIKLFTWITLGVLLVGAILGEWRATTNLSSLSKNNLETVQSTNPTLSNCDALQAALYLSRSQGSELTIQWRRGLIASCGLTIFIPLLLPFSFSSKDLLLITISAWVVITSMFGFVDYHMRSYSSSAIDSILDHTINNIYASADSDSCTNNYGFIGFSRELT